MLGCPLWGVVYARERSEATWDARDGRCVLDCPLWGVVYARERSEATWDAQDGWCVLDRPLWGMVYVGGDVGRTRRAVHARPPIVGHGLHEGVGGATWEEAARRAVLSGV